MPRALFVVSSFRPAMLADMQRARMLAWEMPSLGWRVEVLSPAASEIRQDAVDDDSAAFFPPDLPVHEVESLARAAFELAGSRGHAWRTLLPMYWRGRRLLRSGRFDLVYFSTTSFIYFILGPLWSRSFEIPYVLDFHDPWVREARAGTEASSGALERALERESVVHASGLIAVSSRYIDSLRDRYARFRPGWLAPGRSAVVPFGARRDDLKIAIDDAAPAPRSGDALRLVYVGAGGAIMARSMRLIARALARLRQDGNPLARRARIELYGTSYGWREGQPKFLEQIAQQEQVADLVAESPGRVTYRQSLELLAGADGAIVLGVDDEGYMPSKLFSYALSGKPLLASLRKDSPAYRQLKETPALGELLWFDAASEMPLAEACAIFGEYLGAAANARSFDRSAAIAPFLASRMARAHADLFDEVVGFQSPARNSPLT